MKLVIHSSLITKLLKIKRTVIMIKSQKEKRLEHEYGSHAHPAITEKGRRFHKMVRLTTCLIVLHLLREALKKKEKLIVQTPLGTQALKKKALKMTAPHGGVCTHLSRYKIEPKPHRAQPNTKNIHIKPPATGRGV